MEKQLSWSRKNVLITGGLGHIGSYLMRNLPKEYHLTVVDDLSTQMYCSLFNYFREPFTFIEKSFYDLTADELFGFDVVIHLAARTDAAASVRGVSDLFEINHEKAAAFFHRINPETLVILPSTTSVYGTSVDVVTEDTPDSLHPQSPYAESKLLCEADLRNYHPNSIIYRFGTIFGMAPGARFHTAINSFCWRASHGQPIVIWRENYEHVRPYLGIGDALRAFIFGIENDSLPRETYNVLSLNVKLSDIVHIVQEIVPSTLVRFVDSPLTNQHTYTVSSAKIASHGFTARESTLSALRGCMLHTMEMLSHESLRF